MKKLPLLSSLAFAIVAILASTARADSPITSTDFHRAYMDVEIVAKAAELKMVTAEIANYLMDDANPIDIKAAVVNAISWDIDGKKNSELFKIYLAGKYGVTINKLDTGKLTAGELFSLGYLTVMDDYFSPAKALPLLKKAAKSMPRSYTVAMILALTQAQVAFDSSWCNMWKVVEAVERNHKLERDMRPEASTIILDYMVLYKDECR